MNGNSSLWKRVTRIPPFLCLTICTLVISFLKIQLKSFLLQFLQILSPIVKEIPTHCPPLWENAVRPFLRGRVYIKGVGGGAADQPSCLRWSVGLRFPCLRQAQVPRCKRNYYASAFSFSLSEVLWAELTSSFLSLNSPVCWSSLCICLIGVRVLLEIKGLP